MGVIAIACAGILRRFRERREERERLENRLHQRPSAAVLDDLRRGGKPAREFYETARECVTALVAERGSTVSDAVEKSQELSELLTQAQFYHYGSSAGKAAEAVNASEQNRVIDLLRELADAAGRNGPEPKPEENGP